jgi:hypothetical protein
MVQMRKKNKTKGACSSPISMPLARLRVQTNWIQEICVKINFIPDEKKLTLKLHVFGRKTFGRKRFGQQENSKK